EDVIPAGLKTLAFGLVVGVTGCFIGMNAREGSEGVGRAATDSVVACVLLVLLADVDRKSTRLNSSHSQISYAVFCLKKKRFIHLTGTLASASLSGRATYRGGGALRVTHKSLYERHGSGTSASSLGRAETKRPCGGTS